MKEEKRKEKELERKAAMSIPVAPLPEKELCAYERLRENNIKEREAAMAECEYFDSLKCMKEEMGMAAHYNEIEDQHNRLQSKKKGNSAQKSSNKKRTQLDPYKKDELTETSMKADCMEMDLIEKNPCKELIPEYLPIDECYLHDCME